MRKAIQQLEEEIELLKNQIEELKEELEIAKDNYKSLEWHNNNQYKLLIKYMNAIKLLENKLEIFIEFKNGFEEDYCFVKCWQQDMPLTKEEYELLKEVLDDECIE